MKKWMVGLVLLLCLTFCACSSVETFEIISDVIVVGQVSEPAKVSVRIPDDAALAVMSGNDGQSYEGDHYQIVIQTYAAGDLNKTLRYVTGYNSEQLNLMEVPSEGYNKYLGAWSSVSGEGELVGRCAVLDDGLYHYCLSVLVDANMSGEMRDEIDALFADYSLEGY